MRFQDKVKWLSGALVVLLLVWGLGEFFSPERVAARSQTSSLLGTKPTEAADILLASGSSSVHLVKQGGGWSLMDGKDALPVQGSRVEALLSALAKAGRRRPVAQAKEAWKDLGLDEAEAKTLRVADARGKVLLDLRAGNRGATGAGIYLRFAGSDASYLAESDLSSWLAADRGSWLDLRLWKTSLGSEAVESIEASSLLDFAGQTNLAAGQAPKTLARPVAWKFDRQGEGWKGGPKDADPLAVESVVRAALNLEAADLAVAPPPGAFDSLNARVSLVLGSAKTRLVEVGASAGPGRWWARASEGGVLSPYAFQLSSWSLSGIFRDPSSFAKKNP